MEGLEPPGKRCIWTVRHTSVSTILSIREKKAVAIWVLRDYSRRSRDRAQVFSKRAGRVVGWAAEQHRWWAWPSLATRGFLSSSPARRAEYVRHPRGDIKAEESWVEKCILQCYWWSDFPLKLVGDSFWGRRKNTQGHLPTVWSWREMVTPAQRQN